MSVLNLRGIDEALMWKVKAEAAARGVTLRAFVVEVLTAACSGKALATRAPIGKVVDSPAVVSRIVAEVRANQTPTASRYDPRPAHDPKTCRVYKCGLCASGQT